jgi:hypothetical protein
VDFPDCYDVGILLDLAVHFTAQAEVDAWGTVVLPVLGEFPTLRVNEVHHYQFTDLTLGLPIQDQYVRYYYWLVGGMGPAVEIFSSFQTNTPSPDLTTAAVVQRVFLARPWTASEVRIRLQNGQVRLDWRLESETSGYRVETKPNLTNTNWMFVAEPSANSWTEPVLSDPSRFFRVFVKP